MLCQHSRRRLVSSEKHETVAEAGGARWDTLAVGTVTLVVDIYGTRPDSLKLSSRTAKVLKRLRFRTPEKLYSCETILERLAQDLQNMAAELGQFRLCWLSRGGQFPTLWK
jgi:hypothetical protein